MIKRYSLFIVPLVVLGIGWLMVREAPLALLTSKQVDVQAFTDQEIDGGQSKILKEEHTPHFKSIQFDLEKGFISPYAGMTLFQNGQNLDLSRYSHLALDFELENTKNLELTITTFQNGVTKEHQPLSYRHNIQEIPILGQRTQTSLSLDKMHVAQWWLEMYKLTSTELGEPNWSKASSLSFVAKIQLDEAKPQLLKINGVVFYKDLSVFYIVAAVFLSCWYVVLWFFYRKKQQAKSAQDVVIQYKQIQANGQPGGIENEKDFFDYLTSNYEDPDLTLGQLSEKFEISEKTISATIKKAYNQTFKEFLNGIRITEAKRLMLASNHNISEVAYKVGFNSPNHFNRTFKALEGITPTEYIRLHKPN